MLHILWLIFKVILILLGVILGIALLILLLVLFCPIRYRVYAAKEEEAPFKAASARARISWLFGGVSANAAYEDGTLRVFLKLLFLTRTLMTKEILKKETAAKTEIINPEEPKTGNNVPVQTVPAEAVHHVPAVDTELKPSSKEDIPPDVIRVEPVLPDEPARAEKEEINHTEDSVTQESTPDSEPEKEGTEEEPGITEKVRKTGIIEKISGRIRSVGNKISAFKIKISKTMAKAAWWRDFIFHERTKAAIALILREAKFLVRHVLPKRIRGRLRFGFEDPSVTGKILAFMGAAYPRHRNRVALTPVFENRTVIDGETEISGRIYLVVFAAAAVKIILSRNVRFVIRTFKNRNR